MTRREATAAELPGCVVRVVYAETIMMLVVLACVGKTPHRGPGQMTVHLPQTATGLAVQQHDPFL
jgi:hypothetical protein